MDGNLMPVLFVILAAAFLAIFIYLFCAEFRHKKTDKDQKLKTRIPKRKNTGSREEELPEGFADAVQDAYKEEGSILGMLQRLEQRYPEGQTAEKIRNAKDYLLNSRYKDYETTLYHYLSDGSDEIKELFAGIILKEIGKRMRLPMKQ